MNKINQLKEYLIKIVKNKQTTKDPSHDMQHILRVVHMAEKIGKEEQADLEILYPAAFLHDIIVYSKDSLESKNETDESAEIAIQILKKIKNYPSDKINKVATCIRQCSFTKGIKPDLLEAKILQDADRLEATGAIAIMRTCSSGGQLNIPFYDPKDPFCTKGSVSFRSDLDLFYKRLLIVGTMMHTKTAKKIARRRTAFLQKFLNELRLELEETGIIV